MTRWTISSLLVCVLALLPRAAFAWPVSCSENTCASQCASDVAALGRPVESATSAPPLTGRCELFRTHNFDGFVCTCSAGETAGTLPLTNVLAETPDCFRHGRNHACLLTVADLPGTCDPAAPATVCEAACRDYDDRVRADRNATYEASVQGSMCIGQHECGCVVNTGNACFVNQAHESHDCAQPTRAILDAYRAAHPRAGCSVGRSGGARDGLAVLAPTLLVAAATLARRRARRDPPRRSDAS